MATTNSPIIISNSEGGFPIFSWAIDFPMSQSEYDWDPTGIEAGGDVTTPLGGTGLLDDWGARMGLDLPSRWTQDFLALDPFGAGDVAIGSSLSGFSFEVSRIIQMLY